MIQQYLIVAELYTTNSSNIEAID